MSDIDDTELSTKRYFEGREHAESYKKYRAELPVPIVRRLVHFLEETFDLSLCVGVDVGCGSGQSTKPIAHLLLKVIGVDVSPAQIAAVGKNVPSNIEFKVGTCDNIPVPDNSVQLVTAVNAAHWFDLDKFYKEADRILVPNGVLALIRGTPVIEIKGCEEESQKLYLEFREKTSAYWDEASVTHDYLYKTINLPHRLYVRDESVITEVEVPVEYVIGRIKTYSGIAKFLREDPDTCNKLLKEFEANLMKLIGRPGASPVSTMVVYKRQFVLLMGRKI